MCGSVQHEGMSKRIGNIIPAVRHLANDVWIDTNLLWSGFVREEKLDWWRSQSELDETLLMIDGFTEGTYNFRLKGEARESYGYRIQGVTVTTAVFVKGRLICPAESVRILTRKPLCFFESKIHSRWPVTRLSHGYDKTDYVYGEKDVSRNSPGPLSWM